MRNAECGIESYKAKLYSEANIAQLFRFYLMNALLIPNSEFRINNIREGR